MDQNQLKKLESYQLNKLIECAKDARENEFKRLKKLEMINSPRTKAKFQSRFELQRSIERSQIERMKSEYDQCHEFINTGKIGMICKSSDCRIETVTSHDLVTKLF
jgi:hypothetical protein